jgi:hypothetical protein
MEATKDVTILLNNERIKTLHIGLYKKELDELHNKLSEYQAAMSDIILKIGNTEKNIYELEMLLRKITDNGKKTVDIGSFRQPDEKRATEKASSYDPSMSLSSKVVFVLNTFRKELSTREICDHLVQIDPKILDKYETLENLQKRMGSTLLQKVDNNITFYRVLLPMEADQKQRIYAYGLKEWKIKGLD